MEMYSSSNAQHNTLRKGYTMIAVLITNYKEKSMIEMIFYRELEYQNYKKYKKESGH